MTMTRRGFFKSEIINRTKDEGLLNPIKTVQNDGEIRNWIFEVRKFGFANAPNAIPKSIDSVKQLEKLLTSIIFNCSVQHTGQWRIYTTISIKLNLS